jgi:hypothetical protein
MGYGFSTHVVCGRIGYVRENKTLDKKLVNLSVCSRVFPKRKDGDDVVWYEMAIWGREASNFLSRGFKKGDEFAFSTSSLRATIWTDKMGKCHASLNGNIDKFWDARPSSRMRREGAPEEETPFEAEGGFPTRAEMEGGVDMEESAAGDARSRREEREKGEETGDRREMGDRRETGDRREMGDKRETGDRREERFFGKRIEKGKEGKESLMAESGTEDKEGKSQGKDQWKNQWKTHENNLGEPQGKEKEKEGEEPIRKAERTLSKRPGPKTRERRARKAKEEAEARRIGDALSPAEESLPEAREATKETPSQWIHPAAERYLAAEERETFGNSPYPYSQENLRASERGSSESGSSERGSLESGSSESGPEGAKGGGTVKETEKGMETERVTGKRADAETDTEKAKRMETERETGKERDTETETETGKETDTERDTGKEMTANFAEKSLAEEEKTPEEMTPVEKTPEEKASYEALAKEAERRSWGERILTEAKALEAKMEKTKMFMEEERMAFNAEKRRDAELWNRMSDEEREELIRKFLDTLEPLWIVPEEKKDDQGGTRDSEPRDFDRLSKMGEEEEKKKTSKAKDGGDEEIIAFGNGESTSMGKSEELKENLASGSKRETFMEREDRLAREAWEKSDSWEERDPWEEDEERGREGFKEGMKDATQDQFPQDATFNKPEEHEKPHPETTGKDPRGKNNPGEDQDPGFKP